MTREQVWAQIIHTADDLPPAGFDQYYGWGRINVQKAVEQAPTSDDLYLLNLQSPSHLKPGDTATVNTTLLDMGTNDENGMSVQLLVNDTVVDTQNVAFLASGESVPVGCLWTPAVQGTYNVTCYALPLVGETVLDNNNLTAQVIVRPPRTIMVPTDYAYIQSAINVASEGDTIYLSSGTYNGSLEVHKNDLTIVGENQETTIIDGQKQKDVLLVEGDNFKVCNVTLRNGLYSLMFAGIFVAGAKGVTITNTTTVGNYHGIFLEISAGATLTDNNMTNNFYNFAVEGDALADFAHDVENNTVDGKPLVYMVNESDKEVQSDAGSVVLVNSKNITVQDLNITRSYSAVVLAHSDNCTMTRIRSENNYFGAYLAFSNDINIENNTLITNSTIFLYHSEGNRISNNTVVYGRYGIDLYNSSYNIIDSNTFANNSIGLYIEKSDHNTISNNEVSNNTAYGLLLEKSIESILTGNNMTSNKLNFAIVGDYVGHYVHYADTTNTVDGKSMYYLVNQADGIIEPGTYPNVGYLGLANCTNMTIRDFAFTHSYSDQYGVSLYYSSNSTILNSTFTERNDAIYLLSSSNNTIYNNTLLNNRLSGIRISASPGNTVVENNLTGNNYGIALSGCNNNRIYHNYFYNTLADATIASSGTSNSWDDGYPSGGNYWRKFAPTAVDQKRGSSSPQTLSGSDGISDNPYSIGDNRDRYPLMKIYSGPCDIGITGVKPDKTKVGTKSIVNINVTIINYGIADANFNISASANTTLVGTINVTLTSRNSTSVIIAWNTTGFDKGNYTISAQATLVTGETDLTDNTLVDGTVTVGALIGDINGDGVVEAVDVGLVIRAYGTAPGYPKWNPNADVNGDNKVDASDVGLVIKYYGTHA